MTMFKEIEQVKKEIQEHEGFRDTIYSDSLGFATIGWGHLVKDTDHFEKGVAYSREELQKVFDEDFDLAWANANSLVKRLALYSAPLVGKLHQISP